MTLFRRNKYKIILSVVFLSSSIQLSIAQFDTLNLSLKDSSYAFTNLFTDDAPLELIVKLDLKKFQKEKADSKYHPAELIAYLDDSLILKKQVRMKSRGIFRKDHCSVPPYWLNLRREKDKSDSININEKYKVVCHCNYSSVYEEYLLKEYLAYRIYNILTEYSFRVRLVRFTYVDTGRKNKTYQRWGFIIETADLLAERLNGVQLKLNSIGMYYTDNQITNLLCIYAYLMGNTDWSIAGRHNIKLIKIMDDSKPALIPIPYDFDYTGFVNTSYAIPADGTGIQNVRQRVYIGPCRDILDYQIAAQNIQLKKDEIFSLIDSFEYLPKGVKLDLQGFLTEYFNLVKRNEFFKYYIDIDCREKNVAEE